MCALNQHITIVIVIVVIVNTTTTTIFIIKRRRRSRGGVSDFGKLVSLYLFFSIIIITVHHPPHACHHFAISTTAMTGGVSKFLEPVSVSTVSISAIRPSQQHYHLVPPHKRSNRRYLLLFILPIIDELMLLGTALSFSGRPLSVAARWKWRWTAK